MLTIHLSDDEAQLVAEGLSVLSDSTAGVERVRQVMLDNGVEYISTSHIKETLANLAQNIASDLG